MAIATRCSIVLLLACLAASAGEQKVFSGPWQNPPALPPPTGKVVTVKTEGELQSAVRALRSGTTIAIAPGEYKLTNTVHLHGGLKNVALRGLSGKRDDAILRGPGMRNKNHGNVPHGIMVSDATDVLIANLSVGDVWFHPITLQGPAGCQRVRIHNCRLFEAGEQFLKSNPASPDGAKGGVNDSIVEYCVFEYADTARHWYTEGVDVHAGTGWIVRRNLFRNIRGPAGAKNIGGAVDFWNRSKNNTVEENTIINCAVGIRLGVLDRKGYEDHHGGIIRNNFIYRAKGACHWADVGIIVNDSPNSKVLHNTIILEDDYRNAIECRFPSSQGLVIAGNLTNKAIQQRDGAKAQLQANLTKAQPGWFADPASGDLHLSPRATAVIDKAPPQPECKTDFDGEKRPVGRALDIGADEFNPKAARGQ